MGLPLYREPPAAPRETDRDRDRDPTASARSHIRRRVHSRRVSASDALRRAGLDRDRRSSQQVLLDLLQFTQDNSSSSASVNSASSTAATVASSTASTGSVSGSASTPYAPPQAQGSEPGSRTHPYSLHRRDFSIQLPRPSFEIYRDEPTPLAYGATQSHPYLLPPFVPNNVRVIRHSSATEPPLLPDRDREHEQDSNQVDREAERVPTTEESDSTNRNLRAQLSFDVYSSRMGSLYGRDEEEQPSYVRESSRRFHRTSELAGTFDPTRGRMRDLASAAPTVPEVMSAGEPRRRGENVIDGLGDRARSLSPDDFTTWGYDSSTGIPPSLDPLDLGTHCEFMSDGESEEEEEEEGQREVLVSPGRLFDIFLRETLRRERRQLQTSSVRAGLDV